MARRKPKKIARKRAKRMASRSRRVWKPPKKRRNGGDGNDDMGPMAQGR